MAGGPDRPGGLPEVIFQNFLKLDTKIGSNMGSKMGTNMESKMESKNGVKNGVLDLGGAPRNGPR